jgi:isoquinoline 1-oxidoreductase subunit beta
MTSFRPDRRRFLKLGAGAAGMSLVLGISWSCSADKSTESADKPGGFSANAWLRIDEEGIVTVMVAESEMGQGLFTAIPMLVAEELKVNWSQIRYEHAPLEPVYGFQLTGGSTSIRNSWQTMREAGAIVRELLLEAAAASWKVPVGECLAREGEVEHSPSGRSLHYGQLAHLASMQAIPENVHLKAANEFTIIGRPIARLDCADKINGKAKFGIDIKLPGMLYATVAHCPVFGGKPKHIDSKQARQVAGVLDVFTIDEGVAILAKNTWSAFTGKAALQIEWEPGDRQVLSSESIVEDLRARPINQSTMILSQGNPQEMLGSDAINNVYTLPFQAHVPLEPMNCTASYEHGTLRVWAPTQSPSRAYETARSATQSRLSRAANKLMQKLFDSQDESIEINTTLLGGGFGRRLKQDFVSEAAQIARRIEKPVQLVWTREEDVQHDFYHPLTIHEMRGALDAQGLPLAWHHTIKGLDAKSGGAINLPYDIPHIRVDLIDAGSMLPVGPWRSVEHHYNAFAVEHFFDEMARAGKRDPLELRLRLMSKAPRLKKTLEMAAERSGWSPSSGLFGVASHAGFGSYTTEIVQLVEQGDRFKIAKITCVIDCGIVINPDIAKAQIEGAVVFGMSAALKSSIRISDGRVQQSNYHNYPILSMAETPPIDVILIDSQEKPGGVGEPGVPPLAPAIANAILAATQKPVRELPIPFDRQGFRIA